MGIPDVAEINLVGFGSQQCDTKSKSLETAGKMEPKSSGT